MLIKEYRMANGLTQTQLATLLGYRSSTIITMWESGERRPPSNKLPELAKILGCSIDDLYKENTAQSAPSSN